MSDNSLPGQLVPDNLPPISSDSVVDKRTKNNLYVIKSWAHIFSSSVVDKRLRELVVQRSGASSPDAVYIQYQWTF